MDKLIQSLSALGVSATLVTPNLSTEATTNHTPQLKGADDIVIEKDQDYNVLNGISTYDKEDGDLTHKIIVDGHLDTSKVGTYEIRYNVIDSEGAEESSTRYIKTK